MRPRKAHLQNDAPLALPGRKLLPAPLQRQLRKRVLSVISHGGRSANYDAPAGDPGLFGPRSAVWKVHADFPSMMAGGLAALMLQALHPLALAGVWDHSTFRTDMLGRLRRTITFVGRTTYAPTAAAEDAIQRVRRLHAKVVGEAADGRSYSANDPHLLCWVHCAEAICFLNAYEAYCQAIPDSGKDRYLREFALVAEMLGAQAVPRNQAEIHAYFRRAQSELQYDNRVREVMRILQELPLPMPAANWGRSLFLGAARAVLPQWTHDFYKFGRADRCRSAAGAAGLKLIAPNMRDAMAHGGLGWRSCKRMGTSYEALFHWDDQT